MADNINQALGMAAGASAAGGADPGINAALRYKNAYRAARFVESAGTAIRIFGIVAGVALLSLIMATNSGPLLGSHYETIFFLFTLLFCIMVGALFFILGVIVSALGQQLKASLDAAVNSSPFLDIPAKASAMSLS